MWRWPPRRRTSTSRPTASCTSATGTPGSTCCSTKGDSMKKKSVVRKRKTSARPATRRKASASKKPQAPLLAPVRGADRRTVGHVTLEVGRAGAARVKRMTYPPGYRWSKDMKAIVGTALCMHAHVGFLVQGEVHVEYADGCVVEFA